MIDPIILLISFIFLFTITRPFLMPGTSVDDGGSAISVFVLVLSILTYFFNIDPFPAGLPSVSAAFLVLVLAAVASILLESISAFVITLVVGSAAVFYFGWATAQIPFGALHTLVVGMINAMAMLDVFFRSVFGVPLSLGFFILYLIPATFIYKFSKSLLNYVAIFSETTINFISIIMAFLMLEAVVTGAINPMTLIIGLVYGIAGRLGGSLLDVTMSFFILAISTTLISVALETVAIVVTTGLVGEASGEKQEA